MQNFDEQAEKYLGAVEKQKESEGKAGEGFAVQRKNKRDEEKREIAARAEAFEQFRAACEKKCEEAKNDPEHYGERPVVLDFGNGIKIPVPLKTPGKNWQVGFYEQKEGTILPYLHETDKLEEPDYNIKKESEV